MTTAAVETKQQWRAAPPGVALQAAAAAPGGGGATATTSAGLVPPLEAQLAASRTSLLHPQAFFVSWQVGAGAGILVDVTAPSCWPLHALLAGGCISLMQHPALPSNQHAGRADAGI